MLFHISLIIYRACLAYLAEWPRRAEQQRESLATNSSPGLSSVRTRISGVKVGDRAAITESSSGRKGAGAKGRSQAMKKEEPNRADFPSSAKLAHRGAEIEVVPAAEAETAARGSRQQQSLVEMARRETRVLYTRNSNRGSKGSVHEEIRIYENPFAAAYYSADGREEASGRRRRRRSSSCLFYLKDAFCPIRRTCVTLLCSLVLLVLFASLLDNGLLYGANSKYQL